MQFLLLEQRITYIMSQRNKNFSIKVRNIEFNAAYLKRYNFHASYLFGMSYSYLCNVK